MASTGGWLATGLGVSISDLDMLILTQVEDEGRLRAEHVDWLAVLLSRLLLTFTVDEKTDKIRFLNLLQHPCWPQSHSNLAFNLFLSRAGRMLSIANTTNNATVSTVMGSIVEVSC